ncbi:lycopene cyclase domain-containing protein [Arthrobacter halodurans]|jgi:lycopene cyclase domain-containing protein|uniref:Lycopene cyclase domain-containing protein n=1 Tax=Arthrobacter halodurans TaxID=516699 RepID=A0ABV4UJK3_9MICC
MTFLELNAVFLGVAALAWAAAWAAGRIPRGAPAAVGISIAALFVLTAVFDNVMIASGLFDYGGDTLAGVRIGLAPIEDFAYPLGSAVLLSGLWMLSGPRRGEAG